MRSAAPADGRDAARLRWRPARATRGSATVEFALVGGLLLLILLGIAELGLLLNAQLVVAAAAREGARRAAVDGGASAAAMRRVADQLRLGRIDPAGAQVQIRPHRARYGGPVRVDVVYRYPLLSGAARAVAGSAVELRSTALARSERLR